MVWHRSLQLSEGDAPALKSYSGSRREFFGGVISLAITADPSAILAGPPALASTPLWQPDHTVGVQQFGAVIDGVTDDRAALLGALAHLDSLGGGTLLLPAGSLALASATKFEVTVPNNVTIRGAGRTLTIVKVTGRSEINNLFTVINPNNVWFEDLTLEGNSIANSPGTAGAIFFNGTPDCTSDMAMFGTHRCGFENFRQDYWVLTRNDSSFPMRQIQHYEPAIMSRPGNMRGPTAIGIPSDAFCTWGQTLDAGGIVDGIEIFDGIGEGTYLKCFSTFYSGVRNFHCTRNNLRNFGASSHPNTGSYTIKIYDINQNNQFTADKPTSGWIEENHISAPFSCGVYAVSVDNININRNVVTSQTDTSEELPKGAIVISEGTGTIGYNNVSNCFRGIYAGAPGGGVVHINNNCVRGSVAEAIGIEINATTTADHTTSVNLSGNDVSVTGADSYGLFCRTGRGFDTGRINVEGGSYSGGFAGMCFFDSTANLGIRCSGVALTAGVRLGGSPARAGLICTDTNTSFRIDGLVIDLARFSTAAVGADVKGETRLLISSLTLKNAQKPFARLLDLTGANGSIASGAVKYVNVAKRLAIPVKLRPHRQG